VAKPVIRSLPDKPHLYLTGARPRADATYIGRMSSSTDTPENPRQVGILILEEDAQSAAAVRQLLDSEGWRVSVAADPDVLLSELRDGDWALVVANIAVTGIDSAAFLTLRELSSVDPEEGGRLRTLYIVPEMTGSKYVKALEEARLPFVTRPFHFHDFLEKVSDLLFEVHAIATPLRQVSYELDGVRKKKQEAGRVNTMFATRDAHTYSEEELSAYELQESSAGKKPRTNLGDPSR
jgi:DNA-binding response OmpR family regulator